MFNTVVVLREKCISLTDFVLPRKFSNRNERRKQVSKIDSHHILREASEVSDHVIKQVPGNLSLRNRL